MLSCPKASPLPLFLSPKSATAIPIRSTLHHDALRQFTLDPDVTGIGYVKSLALAKAVVSLDAIVVTRGRHRQLVEIVGDDDLLRDLDTEGLRLLAAKKLSAVPLRLTRDQIQREPVATNARIVWAEHAQTVDIGRRMAIADMLDCTGPTSVGNLCRELGRSARLDVYTLACEATLDVDIGGDLDHAIVSQGRSAVGRGLPAGPEQLCGGRT